MFRFQRQLLTFVATALLLSSSTSSSSCCVALHGPALSVATTDSTVASTAASDSHNHHRRLNNQREDCPVGIGFCDDPFDIMDDPTVGCDEETCAWLVTLLEADNQPLPCRGILIVGEVVDFLEPCFWWEKLHGGPKPTASPSVSWSPSVGPSPGTFSLSFSPSLFLQLCSALPLSSLSPSL
jgi:hypothetical protein